MITRIIVHCSYTRPSQDIGAAEIRKWHTDPKPAGNGWSDIGYQWVIRRDGTREKGRPEGRAGAHTKGFNTGSIGICLVGGMHETDKRPDFNFTRVQMASLEELVDEILERHPGVRSITGHRDHDNRACPTFDVGAYFGQMKR